MRATGGGVRVRTSGGADCSSNMEGMNMEEALTGLDAVDFASQWGNAQAAVPNFDTPEKAAALGYVRSATPENGIGTHWVSWEQIAKPFDPAHPAMLLFDEADSLFGKRTELKTAQDRFANLEVNYILQRMETFDGVSVLTTTAAASLDPALQRRLNFRIRFPAPEASEREALLTHLWPPVTHRPPSSTHGSVPVSRTGDRRKGPPSIPIRRWIRQTESSMPDCSSASRQANTCW